ncbi:MAG: methyltransferase domain-containing protein [Flavobacteriaceae bacterium]
MKDLYTSIENHYLKEGLFEEILGRLKEQGIGPEEVSRTDISGVDEFHVRGAAVSEELASLIDLGGARVLDVGCGIGGPCRMLAEKFDCNCVGIDLSAEFIKTATALSKLVGLQDNTSFLQANAVDLPFEDLKFDVVWTQHVQMNIPDKAKLYSEIYRVLKPGGYFLYYDIFKTGKGEVTYPMPWANTAEQSFLFGWEDMKELLKGLGLSDILSTDQTQAGINFFETLLTKLKEEGPPKIGLNVLMGEQTKPKLMNLLAHLKTAKLQLYSGAYKK